MAPRAGALMLVLLLSGCGHDSPIGPVSPTPTNQPAQQCRHYATGLATESKTFVAGQTIESDESGTCTFDRASATLRCTYANSSSSCPGTRTESTVYASVADFVEEAAAVGRFRYLRRNTLMSGCTGSANTTENNTYDGMKRPLTSEFAGSQGIKASTTFAAWDALGRPTQESSDNLTCVHQRLSLRYDDTARTRTSRITEAGTGQCLSDYTLTVAYDPDGNIVRIVSALHGATSWLSTSTITSADTVCF
jgi:hypothetical protein